MHMKGDCRLPDAHDFGRRRMAQFLRIDQQHRIALLSRQVAAAWKMAELAHPERPLNRGFARVTNRAGETIFAADAARAAVELTLRFADGSVDASVTERTARRGPVERKASRAYMPRQAGLFDQPEEQ